MTDRDRDVGATAKTDVIEHHGRLVDVDEYARVKSGGFRARDLVDAPEWVRGDALATLGLILLGVASVVALTGWYRALALVWWGAGVLAAERVACSMHAGHRCLSCRREWEEKAAENGERLVVVPDFMGRPEVTLDDVVDPETMRRTKLDLAVHGTREPDPADRAPMRSASVDDRDGMRTASRSDRDGRERRAAAP